MKFYCPEFWVYKYLKKNCIFKNVQIFIQHTWTNNIYLFFYLFENYPF